jgi:hypothetical protein
MLTPRNENLGPEDPGFAAWYRNVLAAAVLIWGAGVEGLDWGQSLVVPELVVNGKRVLLNNLAYAESSSGRPIADFLRGALGTPPPPAPAPPPAPIVYTFYTPFLDVDGNWYQWEPWPFGSPIKRRVSAPASPAAASNAAVLEEREATTVYIQGRMAAKIQPQAAMDELMAILIWVANRPK